MNISIHISLQLLASLHKHCISGNLWPENRSELIRVILENFAHRTIGKERMVEDEEEAYDILEKYYYNNKWRKR